jgi:putative transposase
VIACDQYTALLFTGRGEQAGISVSMGSVGDCFDNAVCESFHASLKKELIHRRPWPTRAEARSAIFRYIEGWFNPRRRHSTLEYLSPADHEQAHQEMIAATATTPAELTTEHADRAPVASSP